MRKAGRSLYPVGSAGFLPKLLSDGSLGRPSLMDSFPGIPALFFPSPTASAIFETR